MAKITKIRTRRPRCYLVYALAPDGVKPAEANQIINAMIGDTTLPLALWHDHFIGDKGGCVIFYIENQAELDALFENSYLEGWQVDYRPLIYSFSPAAFDAQTGYTLNAYGDVDWQTLRDSERPDYGARNVTQEVESAEEV
ncbi:MAG: hypothetical protein AB8G95_14960 [Anaerolineae bacterium]